MRKCFRDVTPIRLSQGHPVIALNQEQISCILKTVADETAEASFDMLSSVVTRASQLKLGGSGGQSKQQMHRPFLTYSATSASDTEFISDGDTTLARSETTRGRQSDDDFWNVEQPLEPSLEPSSSVLFSDPPIPGYSRDDPRSPGEFGQRESPGAQTLAEIKREAVRAKKNKRGRGGAEQKTGKSRKAVARSNKIMREDLFEGLTWTPTFVSGPIDPKWNPINSIVKHAKAISPFMAKVRKKSCDITLPSVTSE